MDVQYFIELFFSGLTRGSIYALIALGYTLVYGIIELINFAHGEIYMLGAFTALLVAGVLGIMGFPAGGILVVAALAANGVSEISEIDHIERGYEDIVEKLRGLGADIKRIEKPDGVALKQAQ